MDIKARINEIVDKLKKVPTLMESCHRDPVKTVEKVAGVDIPDNIEDQLVSGVKAALTTDKLAGAADAIKKLL